MAKRKFLTDAAVERQARPATGRTEVKDIEPGLSIRVTPNGRKSWSVVYRTAPEDGPGGRRTEKKRKIIGYHPSMGIAEARQVARKWMELAGKGIDPKEAEAQANVGKRAAASEIQAESFRAVSADWVAAMRSRNRLTGKRKRPVTAATASARESLLRRNVLPTLGDYPLNQITHQHVAQLLNRIDREGGSVDETLKAIRGVMAFAPESGIFLERNSTAGLRSRQPVKKETRALTDNELRSIWAAAGTQGWPFGAVIRLLLLTGQRKMEMAALRWEEVDFERKLIVLPAHRVKNRAGAHEVPLTDAALAILRDAQAACTALARPIDDEAKVRPTDLVFPSETGRTPISGWNKLKTSLDRTVKGNMIGLTQAERRAIRAGGALRAETRALKADALAKLEEVTTAPWRIHDLRHTFITRCRDGDENAEGEVVWSAPLDVLQATVNHEITAGVTATYDHGDIQRRYRLRKRELMEWWSRKLLSIVEPGALADNVVPMRA